MPSAIYIEYISTDIIDHNYRIIKTLYSKSVHLPYVPYIRTSTHRYTAKQQRILCSLLYIDTTNTFAVKYLKKKINGKQYKIYTAIKISIFILHIQNYYSIHSHIIIKIEYSAYLYMFSS